MGEQSRNILELMKEHIDHGNNYNPDCSYCKYYKEKKNYSKLSYESLSKKFQDALYSNTSPLTSCGFTFLDFDDQKSIVEVMKESQIKYNIIQNQLDTETEAGLQQELKNKL